MTKCVFCGGSAEEQRSPLDRFGDSPYIHEIRCAKRSCVAVYHCESGVLAAQHDPDNLADAKAQLEAADTTNVPLVLFMYDNRIIVREYQPRG